MKQGSLAVYKNKPALVADVGEKIAIVVPSGETIKVREKDIVVIFPADAKTALKNIDEIENLPTGDVRGAWELLKDGGEVPFSEMAELAFGEWNPQAAWAAWLALEEKMYFDGDARKVFPRSEDDVAAAEEKKSGREREGKERAAFLERLREKKLQLPADKKFLQDVESLAFGKSEKSKTLKENGRGETPEEAHRLLLECGAWTEWVNPHPARFNINLNPPPDIIDKNQNDFLPRRNLTHLEAFAIDSPWSDDPDDAVSLETGTEGRVLYVHVADPASVIAPDSPADIEARSRGATCYLPEGCVRMLPESALPLFALGLAESSPALTFKIRLADDGAIAETEIFPSTVKVTRLTYEEADAIAKGGGVLAELSTLAKANLERRLNSGAVNIELPDVYFSVRLPRENEAGSISIDPLPQFESAETVRECMLLAGEDAALWAAARQLPFPYITQEAGDIPVEIAPGLAGSYQLRRAMRPRQVSAHPGWHWGLGLDAYTQVTSPLRRYTDLLAHQQIRAQLAKEAGGDAAILSADEVLLRLASSDVAGQASVQAERMSKAHWTAAYLSLAENSGRDWEGIIVEKRNAGTRRETAVVIIPALAWETQIPPSRNLALNDEVRLSAALIKIPEAEIQFVM